MRRIPIFLKRNRSELFVRKNSLFLLIELRILRQAFAMFVAAALTITPIFAHANISHESPDQHDTHSHAENVADKAYDHGRTGNFDWTHELQHCGSQACSPTYFGPSQKVSVAQTIEIVRFAFADDICLVSSTLECDPPIPR